MTGRSLIGKYQDLAPAAVLDMLHAFGQRGLSGFNQQMVMIVHQAICINLPLITVRGVLQHRQEFISVPVMLIDRLLSISPGGDVINRTGVFYSDWSGHKREYCGQDVAGKDLTLLI